MNQKSEHIKAGTYREADPKSHQFLETILHEDSGDGLVVFSMLGAFGNEMDFGVLQQLVEEQLDRLFETADGSVNITHRFEQFLEGLNESIHSGFEEGRFGLRIADTSAIVGIAKDKQLIISGFGNLSAQFLHRAPKDQYDVYNLSQGLRVEDEAPTWKKAFLTVLDGDLNTGDVLYVGSRINRHDLSPNEFNEILTTLPPKSALEKIRQYLPVKTAFGAVVLRNQEVSFGNQAESSESSIQHLEKEREQSQEYIEGSRPSVGAIASRVASAIKPTSRKHATQGHRRLLKMLGRLGLSSLRVAVSVILGALKGIFLGIKSVATNPKRVMDGIKRVKSTAGEKTKTGIQSFNRLPKMSKYILLVMVCAVFLIIIGTSLVHKQKQREEANTIYANAITEIEQKIDTAEASLIYGDEEQARLLLADATDLLSTTPQNRATDDGKESELNERIDTLQKDLRKIVDVESQQLTDLASVEGEPVASIVLDDNTYVLTKSGLLYWKSNETDWVNLELATPIDAEIVAATSEGETFYITDNQGRLGILDAVNANYTPVNTDRNASDVTFFSNRIYALSPDNGQIYKHLASGETFDGGTAWVISNISDLTSGISLAIDGFVWVLNSDGGLLQYLSGSQQEWSAEFIDPALASPTELWTDIDSEYLYILDASESRVLIFDKDGGFISQYVSDRLSDAVDIIVSEESGRAQILTQDEIIEFNLTHL